MNLKKIVVMFLVLGFAAVAAYAQELPMRGMYITNDSNAAFKYVVINGDRSDTQRELQFYDSTGHNVLLTARAVLIRNSSDGYIPRYNFQIGSASGELRHYNFSNGFMRNLTSSSFILDLNNRRITYTKM